MRTSRLSAVLLSAVLASTVAADVPRQFNYQGKLAGYQDETVSLRIGFWTAATGGTELFSETHNAVALQDGVFAIRIGSATTGGVPTGALSTPGWLSLAVNGGPELAPRTRLTSVPFALRALAAETLVIPGTFTAAATVDSDGHVLIDSRVELGAAADGGGVVTVRNSGDRNAVQLDGADSADGGRVEVFNGVQGANVATVVLDGNEASDGRVDLYDANGFDAIRLHADLQNDAPELSLFAGTQSGAVRETVQISGNFDADSAGAGEVRLRRVDAEQSAVTTAILAATSDSLQGLPNSGGYLRLNYIDGSPVFTVQAGAGSSVLVPASMELRAVGSQADQRFRATPQALSLYNADDDLTVSISGSSGDASFDGEVTVGVLTITGGADLAEPFDVAPAGAAPQPGMVVCIDPRQPGRLVVSSAAYDHTVAGVISGAGGVKPGMVMSQVGTVADGQHPVALTGRVWVLCDAGAESIAPGDLLTTADVPGHAMRASDRLRAQGATLGKAMSSLPAGQRGLVLVLVNLQ